jgi:hypothetical protein
VKRQVLREHRTVGDVSLKQGEPFAGGESLEGNVQLRGAILQAWATPPSGRSPAKPICRERGFALSVAEVDAEEVRAGKASDRLRTRYQTSVLTPACQKMSKDPSSHFAWLASEAIPGVVFGGFESYPNSVTHSGLAAAGSTLCGGIVPVRNARRRSPGIVWIGREHVEMRRVGADDRFERGAQTQDIS